MTPDPLTHNPLPSRSAPPPVCEVQLEVLGATQRVRTILTPEPEPVTSSSPTSKSQRPYTLTLTPSP